MRVLVTRPRQSAERTAERLHKLGHQPLILPLTRPHHLPEDAGKALARPCSALVVTSAEAVRAISKLDLSAYFGVPVFAVGSATADEVRHAGFRTVTVADGTGEGLARLLIDLKRQDLLYLAGHPRSPDLEQGLTAAGIRFSTTVCYEMLPLVWIRSEVQVLETAPDAVLLYSSEAARLFMEQPLVRDNPDFWQNCRALCLSGKVARSLGEATKMKVSVASQPTEEALFALLS
jgi:uroporphyrinogen-III synthase